MDRRSLIALLAAALPGAAFAHHGWRWASGEEFTLAGVIRDARLGNPHGLLEVEAEDGALWTVEMGQPWRHADAGLDEALLVPGAAALFRGHRAAEAGVLRMKVERIEIAGRLYDLYPDRS
jgi:hypothetical protein